MSRYTKRDSVELAYAANVKRIRLEGRIVLDNLMNEALAEMTEEFNERLTRGELLNIEGNREELKKYLRRAADKELGPSSGGHRALSK